MTPPGDLSALIPCFPVTRFGAEPDSGTPATSGAIRIQPGQR